jgi:dihydrofolate synthase/folylpolyglutamate synthase
VTHDYEAIRASDTVIARLRALHPTLIDLSTARIERILTALGNPQDRLPPVIHVAGTNGKGSTIAILRSIFEAAGLKAHALTSPHLVRYAERIRVAGRIITDEALSALIDEVEAANAGRPISFFEIGTALAFLAFARTPADATLVEVGLGGRFDATNVFERPAVSVITPVDYDHLEMLGPELAKIAWEKAGIIKRGCPVVCARQSEEALAPIEAEAEALGANLWLMGRDIDAWAERGRLMVQTPDRLLDLPLPGLFGAHQVENAGLAVCAALRLGDRRLTEEAIGRGVATASWAGRFQRLKDGPLGRMATTAGADLWLDGAHNPHGGRALAEAVRSLAARDGRPVALIVGMLARKNAAGFFEALKGCGASIRTVPFTSPTATDPGELEGLARAQGLDAHASTSVEAALQEILQTPPAPHVIICGSLHFVGDVLAADPATWPT